MAGDIYTNVMGSEYEDNEPAFFTNELGVRVFDRVKKRYLNWADLQAKATADGHEWQPREVGIPSIGYQIFNSRKNGHLFAPGLDDTSGLASEAVSNGDEFTGATGSTPPTGWTLVGNATFNLFPSVVNVHGSGKDSGMYQTLSLTPGEYYVCEILHTSSTTSGAKIGIDGIFIPFGPGPADPEGDGTTEVLAFSFAAPEDGSVDIQINVSEGEIASIDHIRVFLESELTGNPGKPPVVIGQTLPAALVSGPFQSGETTYFVQSFPESGDGCLVWFDVDEDPNPDIKLSLQEVCESEVSNTVKLHIHNTLLEDQYCSGLPCMTAAGNLQKKYQNNKEN